MRTVVRSIGILRAGHLSELGQGEVTIMEARVSGFRAIRRLTPSHEDVRWEIQDEDYLARVVALVTLGQAKHAAALISALDPLVPVFNTEALRDAAITSVQIKPGTAKQVKARRWQRDGLIFEVLSWIAIIEANTGTEFLVRDPHLGSTTQGLDGLLLEMDERDGSVKRTVIVEDKCSENPRRTFRAEVMPAFRNQHDNKRAPDLVATAANLLGHLTDPSQAVFRASAVLDLSRRAYRASLAIEAEFDSSAKRAKLFQGYDALTGIPSTNREGGGFVVGDDLRPWFDQFAERVRAALLAMDLSDDV